MLELQTGLAVGLVDLDDGVDVSSGAQVQAQVVLVGSPLDGLRGKVSLTDEIFTLNGENGLQIKFEQMPRLNKLLQNCVVFFSN